MSSALCAPANKSAACTLPAPRRRRPCCAVRSSCGWPDGQARDACPGCAERVCVCAHAGLPASGGQATWAGSPVPAPAQAAAGLPLPGAAAGPALGRPSGPEGSEGSGAPGDAAAAAPPGASAGPGAPVRWAAAGGLHAEPGASLLGGPAEDAAVPPGDLCGGSAGATSGGHAPGPLPAGGGGGSAATSEQQPGPAAGRGLGQHRAGGERPGAGGAAQAGPGAGSGAPHGPAAARAGPQDATDARAGRPARDAAPATAGGDARRAAAEPAAGTDFAERVETLRCSGEAAAAEAAAAAAAAAGDERAARQRRHALLADAAAAARGRERAAADEAVAAAAEDFEAASAAGTAADAAAAAQARAPALAPHGRVRAGQGSAVHPVPVGPPCARRAMHNRTSGASCLPVPLPQCGLPAGHARARPRLKPATGRAQADLLAAARCAEAEAEDAAAARLAATGAQAAAWQVAPSGPRLRSQEPTEPWPPSPAAQGVGQWAY